MENLATELCTKIFKSADFKTKLNLTLVCRRFNFIISESLDLMQDFKLSIDLRNVDWNKKTQRRGGNIGDLCLNSILESNRKYQHLTISSFNNQNLEVIIEKFSSHLKSFNFHGSITGTNFIKVLKNLQLLEDASFNVDVYDDPSLETCQQLSICPNLTTLKCESELNFYLEIFKNSVKNLKALEINGYKVFDDYDSVNFRDFLKLQPNLKTLKIYCMHATELFQVDFASDLKFKLEHFESKDLALSTDESRANFLNFLTAQSSLTSLKFFASDWDTTWISNQDCLFTAVLRLEKLESLELSLTKCDFESPTNIFKRINPSVKKFIFKNTDPDMFPISESMILENFVHSMPNLRILEFVTVHAASSSDLNCLNQLHHLEELQIRDCEFDAVKNLKLPLLNKIKLCAYEEDEDIENDESFFEVWDEFFRKHNNLQYFTFNLEFSENILKFLFAHLQKIKHLELTISETNLAEIILNNYKMCKNLKFIKITVEPPQNSKYLEKIDEFLELFCIKDNFAAEHCGLYSQYLEFKKEL